MRFNLNRIAQAAPTLLLATGLTATSVAPAQAFFWFLDPNVVEYHDHFIRCKGLGFSDPDQHAKECGPFNKHPAPFIDIAEDDTPKTPQQTPPPPQKLPPKMDYPSDSCSGECEEVR